MVQIILERAASRKAYEVMVHDFAKGDFASLAERVTTRHDHNKADLPNRKGLKFLSRIDRVRDNTDVREALGD
jgi:hypothetical protein